MWNDLIGHITQSYTHATAQIRIHTVRSPFKTMIYKLKHVTDCAIILQYSFEKLQFVETISRWTTESCHYSEAAMFGTDGAVQGPEVDWNHNFSLFFFFFSVCEPNEQIKYSVNQWGLEG